MAAIPASTRRSSAALYPLVFDERCEPQDTEPAMAIDAAYTRRTEMTEAASVRCAQHRIMQSLHILRQMRSDGTGSAPLRSDASNEDLIQSHGVHTSLRFALSWIID